MKPPVAKWCIIEIKGQGDVRVSLFTLTTVTDAARWPLRPEIATLKPGVIRLRSSLKGPFECIAGCTCVAQKHVLSFWEEGTY